MMYVDTNYLNYKYVYSYGDNYVALVSRSSVNGSFDNPQNVNVHVQYFSPSTYSFDYIETFRNARSFTEIDVSDDFYSRADCPQLMNTIMFLIFFLFWLLNPLYKFVSRGGLFFGE